MIHLLVAISNDLKAIGWSVSRCAMVALPPTGTKPFDQWEFWDLKMEVL